VLHARYAPGAGYSPLLILHAAAIGGSLATTVMGGYLLFCLNRFGRHWNEAFPPLRVQNFKNFVRLRIAADGELTVFPIGLADVPRDDFRPSAQSFALAASDRGAAAHRIIVCVG